MSVKIIRTYLLGLLTVSLINVIFDGPDLSFSKSLGFWIGPIAFICIGLFFGLLINLVNNKPNNNSRIFYLSALTSCIVFCLILFTSRFSAWRHERNYGNIERNEDYFKYWTESFVKEKRIAFKSLIGKFQNQNDIEIVSISVDISDSTVNFSNQIAYRVRLIYKKQNNKLKSDVIVFRDTAHLQYFDQPLTTGEKQKIDSTEKAVLKAFADGMKSLTDSTRKQIESEFENRSVN